MLSSCSKEIYPNYIQMDIFCLEENLGYKSIINLIFYKKIYPEYILRWISFLKKKLRRKP